MDGKDTTSSAGVEARPKMSAKLLIVEALIVLSILLSLIPVYRQFELNSAVNDLASDNRQTRIDAARRLREIGEKAKIPVMKLMVENQDLQLELRNDPEVMRHLKHVLEKK